MTEEEQLLQLVSEVLSCAEDVRLELERDLADIENPKIRTDASKKQTIERMRLINSVIFAGEKAKESLEAEKGPQKRLRRK